MTTTIINDANVRFHRNMAANEYIGWSYDNENIHLNYSHNNNILVVETNKNINNAKINNIDLTDITDILDLSKGSKRFACELNLEDIRDFELNVQVA